MGSSAVALIGVLKAGPIVGLVYGILLCAFAKPGERLVVIAFGAGLGLFAEVVVWLQGVLSARALSIPKTLLEKALLVAGAHAVLVVVAMAESPSAYAAAWYARGGLSRTVQVVATDVVGPLLARSAAPPFAHGAPPSPGASKMNVLLIVADSLRADRIEPRVAPNLSALASRGVSFDRAYVSSPETLPSFTTLLTGKEPHGHGVRSAEPPVMAAGAANAFAGAAEGYATVAIGDFARTPLDRIELGFSDMRRVRRFEWPAVLGLAREVGPELVAEEVDRTLRERKAPFFATVYFPTAARPYAAPAPYYARYTDARYRGRFKYDARSEMSGDLDAADVSQLTSLYDGAVSAVDDAVGRVLRSLEASGLADHTIVAVIGSHGEELPRVGAQEASTRIGDARTHVPLIFFDPRLEARGTRRAEIVRDVDVLPTLRELAGLGSMPNLPGRSLAPAIHGLPMESRPAFAEGDAGRNTPPGSLVFRQRMAREDRYELVYAPERSGVRYLLFDTASDPGEEHDIAASHPDELGRLRTALWSWMLEDDAMEERGGYLVPKRSEHDHDNVLLVAIDGLRADAATPAIDALAKRGARFTHAFASGIGPRFATLSLLGGARPSEVRARSAREAELVPRVLASLRARGGAFVEDGRELAAMGFETVSAAPDRAGITRAAERWMTNHAKERFFAFVHLAAPSGEDVRAVDDAVGELAATVETLGLRERTLVVIAGTYGGARSGEERPSNLAASTRVPLVVVAPKQIRAGTTVEAPVRTIDIAPTILELAGIEPPALMSGRSLVRLAAGAAEADRRVVVTEGPSSRAIEHESWRFVVTGRSERLFDLAHDPAEQRDLYATKPDVVAEMRARLEAALANVPVASAAGEERTSATIHLRFAGGGAARRVAGIVTVGDARTKATSYESRTVDLGPEAVQGREGKLDIAFRTHPASAVGFDIVVDPPTTPVTWQFWLDDEAWPDSAVFAGPFGLATRATAAPLEILHGMATAEGRALADGALLPTIDPVRDLGLFVVRESSASHMRAVVGR